MRFFGASLWRFPSFLHARGEHSGTATQRSTPSVLRLRTGVRIPPPPDFARLPSRASYVWASQQFYSYFERGAYVGEVCPAEAASEASASAGGPPAHSFVRAQSFRHVVA